MLTAWATALVLGTEPRWLVAAGDAEGSLGKCGLHPDGLSKAQVTEMAGEGGSVPVLGDGEDGVRLLWPSKEQ